MFNFVELSEIRRTNKENNVQESLFLNSDNEHSQQISLIGYGSPEQNDFRRITSNRESVPMINLGHSTFPQTDELFKEFIIREDEVPIYCKQEPGSLRTSVTQALPRRSPRESLQVIMTGNRLKRNIHRESRMVDNTKTEESTEHNYDIHKIKKNRGKKKLSRSRCNCNKTKCLKLYCECFAAGRVCSPKCRCLNCHNREDLQELRQLIIKDTVEKNPLAFTSKFKKIDEKNINKLHSRGCNCQKTGCVKNYCECFRANIGCSPLCNCKECKNEFLQVELKDVTPYKDKVLRKRKKRNYIYDFYFDKNRKI